VVGHSSANDRATPFRVTFCRRVVSVCMAPCLSTRSQSQGPAQVVTSCYSEVTKTLPARRLHGAPLVNRDPGRPEPPYTTHPDDHLGPTILRTRAGWRGPPTRPRRRPTMRRHPAGNTCRSLGSQRRPQENRSLRSQQGDPSVKTLQRSSNSPSITDSSLKSIASCRPNCAQRGIERNSLRRLHAFCISTA